MSITDQMREQARLERAAEKAIDRAIELSLQRWPLEFFGDYFLNYLQGTLDERIAALQARQEEQQQ